MSQKRSGDEPENGGLIVDDENRRPRFVVGYFGADNPQVLCLAHGALLERAGIPRATVTP
jgi:hypothetical protein